MNEETSEQENNRNLDGTFKPGVSGNPGGRPKGGLKAYDRQKFVDMTEEEKEKFLKTISPELRYRMAEGNPQTNTDVTSGGKPFIISSTILDKNDIKTDD